MRLSWIVTKILRSRRIIFKLPLEQCISVGKEKKKSNINEISQSHCCSYICKMFPIMDNNKKETWHLQEAEIKFTTHISGCNKMDKLMNETKISGLKSFSVDDKLKKKGVKWRIFLPDWKKKKTRSKKFSANCNLRNRKLYNLIKFDRW